MSDLIAAHEAQIRTLNDNVSAMRITLEKIGDAIIKLAILEERHANTTRELQATRDQQDDLRHRVKVLEENNVRLTTTISTLARTARVLWGAVGTIITAGVVWVLRSMVTQP